jgi:hypothetical protein
MLDEESRGRIDLSGADVTWNKSAGRCRHRNNGRIKYRRLLIVNCPQTRTAALALQVVLTTAILTADVTIPPTGSDWQEKNGEK